MEKQFSDVSINENFTVNGMTYTKIQEVRVSCCKSVNCHEVNNTNARHFFPGNTMVTVTNNG
jgi:hypothetical protein